VPTEAVEVVVEVLEHFLASMFSPSRCFAVNGLTEAIMKLEKKYLKLKA